MRDFAIERSIITNLQLYIGFYYLAWTTAIIFPSHDFQLCPPQKGGGGLERGKNFFFFFYPPPPQAPPSIKHIKRCSPPTIGVSIEYPRMNLTKGYSAKFFQFVFLESLYRNRSTIGGIILLEKSNIYRKKK